MKSAARYSNLNRGPLLSRAYRGILVVIFLCMMPLRASPQQQAAVANYKEKCAVCHGTDGSGKTAAPKRMNVPDLRSKAISSMTDDELYETIAKGTKHKEYPHAYLYTGLKESEIRDIVKYIRTIK